MKSIVRFFVFFNLLWLSKVNASSFQHVLVGFEKTTVDYIADTYPVNILEEYEEIAVLSVYASQNTIREMTKDPNLSFVSFNNSTHQIDVPETASYSLSNYFYEDDAKIMNNNIYKSMNIQHAHANGQTGKNVSVCVVDTGIDASHSSLKNKLVASEVFVEGTRGARFDGNGHGTHVAGIIVGLGSKYNVSGVAPDAKLYSAKVFDDDGIGDTEGLLAGVNWCLKKDIDIINMSLSYPPMPNTPYEEDPLFYALERAHKKGVLNIAATGNENESNTKRVDNVSMPARLPHVLAVGSVNVVRNGNSLLTPISAFSNIGPSVALVAPGEEILSTYPNQDFAVLSGTSMAAPMVSGMAALYMQINPTGTPNDISLMMQKSAKDIGPVGKDVVHGYGLASYRLFLDDWTQYQPTLNFTRSIQSSSATVSWNKDIQSTKAYQIYLNGSPVKRTTQNSYQFTIKPSETYRIQIALIDADGKMSKKSNTFSFQKPTISFKDVNSNHWAKNAIVFVAEKKWLDGYQDGTFRPAKGVTRAEAAVTLSRILPSKKTYRSTGFADVPKSHYAYDAIMKMSQAKIMVGSSPTSFKPNQVMTREELTVIMARLMKEKNYKGKSTFADVQNKNRYSYQSIVTMKHLGYVSGCSTTQFCPDKTISRAEFAALLSRMGVTMQARNK